MPFSGRIMRPVRNGADGDGSYVERHHASGGDRPARPANRARIRWAVLLARGYGVLPLICTGCGGQMKILAFLTDPPVVSSILLQ